MGDRSRRWPAAEGRGSLDRCHRNGTSIVAGHRKHSRFFLDRRPHARGLATALTLIAPQSLRTLLPMARSKTPSPPPGETPSLETVVESFAVEASQLRDEVKILREAIDDLRVEVEWLARNLLQSRWMPAQSLPQ